MAFITLVAFMAAGVTPSHAQGVFFLPEAGKMLELSDAFAPALLKGVTIHPQEPLLFDFIVDSGHSALEGKALTEETTKLVKYFLAGLAIPEKDLWVNLSPVENDRIMADDLSRTDVGRDMLAQDYLLKQITSTLMYPEKDLGKAFWAEVYKRTYEEFGNTDVPMEAFNKVWITPDEATVYQKGNNAFVSAAHLKVMLESDYLAMTRHSERSEESPVSLGLANDVPQNNTGDPSLPLVVQDDVQDLAKDVVREVILPVLEKEVNEGRNFAALRQIFHSMILAGWYKNALKESLLNQVYSNTNKVQGIDIADKDVREKVYARYLEAYRKGVYNYIKEDVDVNTREVVERKYFSGGISDFAMKPVVTTDKDRAGLAKRFIGKVSRIAYALQSIFQEEVTSGIKIIHIAKVETYTSFGQAFAIVHLPSSLHAASLQGRSFILRGANFSLDVTPAIIKEMDIFQGKAVTFEVWIRRGWEMDPLQMKLEVHTDAAALVEKDSAESVKFVSAHKVAVEVSKVVRIYTPEDVLEALHALKEAPGPFNFLSLEFMSAKAGLALLAMDDEIGGGIKQYVSGGEYFFTINNSGLAWLDKMIVMINAGFRPLTNEVNSRDEEMDRNIKLLPGQKVSLEVAHVTRIYTEQEVLQAIDELKDISSPFNFLDLKFATAKADLVLLATSDQQDTAAHKYGKGRKYLLSIGEQEKAWLGRQAQVIRDSIADRKEANRLAMIFATGNPRTDADILAGYKRLRGKVAAVEERIIFPPLEDGIMYAVEKEYGPGGRHESPLFENSAANEWKILDKTGFLQLLDNKIQQLDKSQDNKLVQGGIDLGQGDYLKVISTDPAGMPAFDPAQLMQLQKDLRGIVPVPVGVAQPVNLESLT